MVPRLRPFRAAGALLIATVLLLPVVAAEPAGGPYVARSMWSGKHLAGIDRLWLLLRDPWDAKPTGDGVRVAVIDTGIDPRHPDLEGTVVAWRDFIEDRPDPYDDHGHGTHVAAILAGRGHLQANPLSSYFLTGERGVAPGAHLLVAKAMRADGTGDDATVARAIRWAVDPNGDGDTADGASIINLSVGFDGPTASALDGPSALAIAAAVRAGVVVVVASGNDGTDHVLPPADAEGALVVGAVDSDGAVAAFSNWGPELDVVAPGIVVSAYPHDLDGNDLARDGYTGMAGTSMAVPFVAGVVALMMDADPALARTSLGADLSGKVDGIEEAVKSTARSTDDVRAGAGLIDAEGAVGRVDRGTDAWDPSFLVAAASLAIGVLAGAWLSRRRGRSGVVPS